MEVVIVVFFVAWGCMILAALLDLLINEDKSI